MKVIHEIIDYLLNSGFISQHEVEVLEKRGYYDKPRLYDDDIYYYYKYKRKDQLWDEFNSEENLREEKYLEIERQFEEKDRRRVKELNRSSKTKRKIRSDQKKGDINLFAKENELWWQPPERIRITNRICSRVPEFKRYKEYVFTNVSVFWDHLFKVSAPVQGLTHSGDIPKTLLRHKSGGIRSEWIQNFLENCDIVMEVLNEKNYKLKAKKHIHPKTYCKLIKSRKFESHGWSIFLIVDRSKSIQITNKHGAFTLKKMNT